MQCNKIRVVQQRPSMVVTHSDCAEVFVWDFAKQPDFSTMKVRASQLIRAHAWVHRARTNVFDLPKSSRWSPSRGTPVQASKKSSKNAPDLKLVGHKDLAPFALATSTASASIASGGEDTNVLVWNLADLGEQAEAGRGARGAPTDILEPRHTLSGHEATVSDVCFKPESDTLLVSSADDHVVKLWDTRQSAATQNVRTIVQRAATCMRGPLCAYLLVRRTSPHVFPSNQVYVVFAISSSSAWLLSCAEYCRFSRPIKTTCSRSTGPPMATTSRPATVRAGCKCTICAKWARARRSPVFTFEQTPEDAKAVLTVSWNPLKPVRALRC